MSTIKNNNCTKQRLSITAWLNITALHEPQGDHIRLGNTQFHPHPDSSTPISLHTHTGNDDTVIETER